MGEVLKRYLAVLVFTGLNSEKHKKLKLGVKHAWVRNNTDSLPMLYERLMEMTGEYEGTRDRPRKDPRNPGVAFMNAQSRGTGGRGDCAG